MNLFLIPASRQNAEQTLRKTVALVTAEKVLKPTVLRRLKKAIAPRRSFSCWAMTETSRRVFDHMQPGDVVAVTVKGTGKFNYKARVAHKLESSEFGNLLWPYTRSQPWKLIYVLEDLKEINVDKGLLVTHLEYADNDRVSGSRVVKADAVTRIIRTFGSIDELLQTLDDPDWTLDEIQRLVADYMEQLKIDLDPKPDSTIGFRQKRWKEIKGHSKIAVEFKRRNISAELIRRGFTYLDGYPPARNYQPSIRDEVEKYTDADSEFLKLVKKSATLGPPTIDLTSFGFEDSRETAPMRTEKKSNRNGREYKGRKFDYTRAESENRKVGDRGEDFVVAIEKDRLQKAGRIDLADRVQRVSLELDGLGYDVISFDEKDNSEICIEVKATKRGKDTPFFLTANELQFSIDHCSKCYLYRVFNLDKRPKFFSIKGSLVKQCHLIPQVFLASF